VKGNKGRPNVRFRASRLNRRRTAGDNGTKRKKQSGTAKVFRLWPNGPEVFFYSVLYRYFGLAPAATGAAVLCRHRRKIMFFKTIREDIAAVKERDPAARTSIEVLLLYSGLHAILYYRLAHWFYKRKWYFLARLISQSSRFLTGVEIHPAATIGKRLFIDHGSGIVIGETTIIGDDCTLYQGVTLGGTGKDKGKRHPTLGDNVMVGAGARVLGPFKVGDNSKIAANAVVLEEVPPNSTAVGVPARIVNRQTDNRILDQIHIPDPVAQQLCAMAVKIQQLELKISRMQQTEEEI
jgi:serine O-acetyltransferase